ncbi:ATP12 family chaperone protein [Teichococcus aestuarii]|uniref:hypothetical protein n=1 Tax=Teichococcus aestuarii TaxID=568898 RepID=UPI003610C784
MRGWPRGSRARQPLLDWVALTFDAPLRVTTGVMPVPQPPEAERALHAAVAALPVLKLAALGVAVPALGSLVLGGPGAWPAGRRGSLPPAFLDETFQQELWGQDREALERQQGIVKDVALAERLLDTARG